jgi:hypothetical protein
MAGRPTLYKSAFNKQAEKFCKLGATDEELADFFECDVATLNRWKIKYPTFRASIKKGKDFADAEVADLLFQRATGYSHPEIDIKVIKNKIVKTKLIKHYPPDTAAAIFWLKNRQKSKWRDKIEHGLTDGNGKDVNPVYVFRLPENGRDIPAAGS